MVQVALLGIVTVFMALLFKSGKSEYAVLISLTGCVLLPGSAVSPPGGGQNIHYIPSKEQEIVQHGN